MFRGIATFISAPLAGNLIHIHVTNMKIFKFYFEGDFFQKLLYPCIMRTPDFRAIN